MKPIDLNARQSEIPQRKVVNTVAMTLHLSCEDYLRLKDFSKDAFAHSVSGFTAGIVKDWIKSNSK